MITFLASILIWLMFFGLIVLWVVDGKIRKETVVHALFASLVAWTISEIIKYIFPSLRPFQVNDFTPLTLTVPWDGAFPSGHTALAFALSVTILKHDKKVGVLYLIMAGLVGIARIMAHVHYPIDIVGGAILGTLTSEIVNKKHLFKFLG